MRTLLMYRDRNFDLEKTSSPPNERDLIQDLELEVLLHAMSGKDEFLHEVAKKVLLSSLTEPDEITYRQNVLRDCLKNPVVLRDLYRVVGEAIEEERHVWGWYTPRDTPDQILSRAVRVLRVLTRKLAELRAISDAHAGEFESEGFRQFLVMIKRELSDEYLARVEGHLRELEFKKGSLVSAELTDGAKGNNYTLRKRKERPGGWVDRVVARGRSRQYSYTIDDRDETGPRLLIELRERGINGVANAVAQSAEHVKAFFKALKLELAFYVACLNLYERLVEIGEPVCFPVPSPPRVRALSHVGLYDPCLGIKLKRRVVGNDVEADGKEVAFVTGANRGGKSTFLRSVGVAQILMQCGAFVPAESYSASVCSGVFTHFKRGEDPSMKSGKLDEELGRMSKIVDYLSSNSMMLFNESFASTNEREGSEIARQLVRALLERGVRVVFVTHQYELAKSFYDRKTSDALFLRAERRPDGERTFRMIPGEPLQTSYGGDLYDRIFLAAAANSRS
jgi:DNA mismatch repair ATPase MutS